MWSVRSVVHFVTYLSLICHCVCYCNLQELPFQMIQHSITLVDAQVTVDGGLIVMVVGQLKVSSQLALMAAACPTKPATYYL